MMPIRRVKRSRNSSPGPIQRFFDFLVPPVVMQQPDEDEMELADFTRVMQYATSWRELRMLVDVILEQLDTGKAQGTQNDYATFMIQRDGIFLLLGVKVNETGDEIHITQQVVNQHGRSTGEPAHVKLVFDDIEGATPREA